MHIRDMRDIARVDGAGVLFVGPLDLSIIVGMPKRFEDPEFRKLLSRVAACAKEAGKAAGILLPSVRLLAMAHDMGFTFVAVVSDGGLVVEGMKNNIAAMQAFKS